MKLLLPVLLPIFAGILVLLSKGLRKKRTLLTAFVAFILAVEASLVLWAVWEESSVVLFSLTNTLTIASCRFDRSAVLGSDCGYVAFGGNLCNGLYGA